MTKEQIQCLSDDELRAIWRSTSPTTDRFALELNWARDEMDRRYTKRCLERRVSKVRR